MEQNLRTCQCRLHDCIARLQVCRTRRLECIREPLDIRVARGDIGVRIAGTPDDVVERAQILLGLLEDGPKQSQKGTKTRIRKGKTRQGWSETHATQLSRGTQCGDAVLLSTFHMWLLLMKIAGPCLGARSGRDSGPCTQRVAGHVVGCTWPDAETKDHAHPTLEESTQLKKEQATNLDECVRALREQRERSTRPERRGLRHVAEKCLACDGRIILVERLVEGLRERCWEDGRSRRNGRYSLCRL